MRNAGPRDTILHIGPGVLYDGIDYATISAKTTIVEPDSDIAAELRIRFSHRADVTIIENAVLAESGDVELRKYNFRMLNSMRRGDGLLDLFPGLQSDAIQTVRAIDINDVVKRLPKGDAGRDILVIDSLGEEFSLLRALDAAGQLERFGHVIIRTTMEVLFVGGSDLREIKEWLKGCGFDRPIRLDDGDPDLPVLSFSRNPLLARLAQEQKVSETLRADIDRHEKAVKEAEDAAMRAERDLKMAIRTHAATQSDLRDLQSQYATLRAAKEERDALLTQVTKRLSDASEHLHRLTASQDANAELRAEVDPQTPPHAETGQSSDAKQNAPGVRNRSRRKRKKPSR